MNPDFPVLSLVLFASGATLCVIALAVFRFVFRWKRSCQVLLAKLPDHDGVLDLDTRLRQCFERSGVAWDTARFLRSGFLDLTQRVGLAGALYDPATQVIEYNPAFARQAGVRNQDLLSIHALELPLFGDLFRNPPPAEGLVELGNIKLKIHLRQEKGMVMAVLENIAEKEQEEADRRYFSNTLWHEIKTPVTVMKGFTNILLEEIRDPFLLKATATIEKQVDRLAALIGNLRTLADKRNMSEALCRSQDVTDILRQQTELWQEEAAKRNLTVTLHTNTPEKTVYALRLTRGDFFVLASNLISNAIKFTQEGGQVKIKTEILASALSLEINDSGPGVPPQLQAILYSPLGYEFLEGEGSRGMGLYLVKEAVERGDGRIAFKSAREGTSYRISLPFHEGSKP
ncbi:MAG TPA: HAMP domain-containing sensor histidine kinase [Atribacteraceae bacterium]|nr:HAMP domain-containing sensor histidine kinase [Atribacteraceae bacterium]